MRIIDLYGLRLSYRNKFLKKYGLGEIEGKAESLIRGESEMVLLAFSQVLHKKEKITF